MEKSLRVVYGETLAELGKENPDFVVLDADVSNSTMSRIFGESFPDRFFNVGIAEANMVAMSAGFSEVGYVPFVNTFGVFLTSIGLIAARTYGSYSHMNMKLVGAYGGMSDALDGPTHHSLEDIAIMRTLPNFEVIVASDAVQTEWIVEHALKSSEPMYIRLSREAMAPKYDKKDFEASKGMVLRDGGDVTIIACGVMVDEALKAADILKQDGIGARVIDMFFVKPIDKKLVLESAGATGAIVTAEEHSVIGGLGSAVAEVLSSEGGSFAPQEFVGLQDTHAECGPYGKLFEKYGISAASIAEAAKKAISRK
jgi:transketolase